MATLAFSAAEAESNDASNPSPPPLTTPPPLVVIFSVNSASWTRRSWSARTSPSVARSAVEPTRSVNTMVAMAAVPVMATPLRSDARPAATC
ncbi:MAG: hypothetical protein ACKV2O_04480 [Acidimicrobiales bacterium]